MLGSYPHFLYCVMRMSGTRFLVAATAALMAVPYAYTAPTPITDPTNSYYTPKKTYTPITTYPSAQGGHPTTIAGVGPKEKSGSYTWVYTVPSSTPSPTSNPELASSLSSAGIHTDSKDKNLKPNPDNLQVRLVNNHSYTGCYFRR